MSFFVLPTIRDPPVSIIRTVAVGLSIPDKAVYNHAAAGVYHREAFMAFILILPTL